MALFAFLSSPSDIGPFEACLGNGMAINGKPPDPNPGVRAGDIIPPGVLGPPSLANDPHPGVLGVCGEAGENPDQPCNVGKFLIG
jgi:hypothetical protein